MTTPINELQEVEPVETDIQTDADDSDVSDERRRRGLLLLLLLLLLLCCCAGYFIVRYMLKPEPLPDMVPIIGNVNYPPSYKFSFPAEEPVGVAVSPDGERIYVAESAGERIVKIFDRDGNFIKSFSPPFVTASDRRPTYIAVDVSGRVFISDIYNDVIGVFDPDGNLIDGIIYQDISLSEVVSKDIGGAIPEGTQFYFGKVSMSVNYQLPNGEFKHVSGINQDNWSPVGLRFDQLGNLLVTNIVAGRHEVIIYPVDALNGSWLDFDPQLQKFGTQGTEPGQLSFPNSAVTDRLGNYYVSDGNNARISFWTPDFQYGDFFGFGSSDSALNLPRGMWMDTKDRLHVADAVGQFIRVYDVSGTEPAFLYNFGTFGDQEGEFNFPTDICIDGTGRLYIADRENNRIQVWSY